MNITIITITKEPIRLGQFLKLADLVQDGFKAKVVIDNGEVKVNGVIDTRRGKKLVNNDIVSYKNKKYKVKL